jgi:hypothetical protein
MRPLRPALQFGIMFLVIVVAFVVSSLLSIVASVNLSVPVQNSNRKLDTWVASLQSKGYSLYFADSRSSTSTIKASTIAEFENMLKDHEVTEAYWRWTQLAFPFQIVYGQIWFTDEGTTYYIETSW